MGPPRHLSLLPDLEAERIPWPVPFDKGVTQLLARRGQAGVVLASGDPFWFGAGAVLARHLEAHEWRAEPGRSSFSLVASRLGWALERTGSFGLHAAPLSRLRGALAPGAQLVVLLRDGAAVTELAGYLVETGFGASSLTVFEALGGPRERRTDTTPETLPDAAFQHPVCAAIDVAGPGAVLPLAAGRPDSWFAHDGQITKRPVRALTLSALAPRPFEHLWDIGGGSGSVAIEWLLAHRSLTATSFETDPERAARITRNARHLGVDRLAVIEGTAPDTLVGQPMPDAVFVGGGLSQAMLDWLADHLPAGTRIVANAVTLESEALLAAAQRQHGGTLMRIEMAEAAPLGSKRGWAASYPIVQWSGVL